MEQIQNIDANVDKFMSTFLKKPTLIKGAIYLVLMLYAARVAPKPPQAVLNLFENQYFKLFFFALILWTAQFSPSTSLLIAVSFLITMNYFGQKALWEFMENTESGAPIAPTKEVAMETSAAIIENQIAQPEIVQTMTQEQETIVIQPTVVQTPEGATIQTPNVVVAPAVVANENGEKLLVKPEVTFIEVPTTQESAPAPAPMPQEQEQEQAPAPSIPEMVAPEQQAAVSAISSLAAAAASPEPSSPQQVGELAQIAAAAIPSTEGKEAVEKLAQQAVKAEAAPAEEVKETAISAIQEIITPPQPQAQAKEEMGCYPVRRYDMSKVTGFMSDDFYGSI